MRFDIVVVGGGLVGASFAHALHGRGLRIALVEAQAAPVHTSEPNWDNRVYAISPGSADFLASCGIWSGIDASRLTPVFEMRINADRDSRLSFDANSAGVAQLAWIVENRALTDSVHCRLRECSDITQFRPALCERLTWDRTKVRLQLSGSCSLEAQLVVGADGADSWLRTHSGISSRSHDYEQMAVVANFSTQKPHRNIARQWFRADGVLAFLPLPGNRVSIVFSTAATHASELLALPPEHLAVTIAQAGDHTLGELATITPAAMFPLQRLQVERLIGPRMALLGDAAHVIHPLAGQGVNLGFRDAYTLAREIISRGALDDCGDTRLLRRYERARKEHIFTMTWATDALQKLFCHDDRWLTRLRNTGLQFVDHSPQLKRLLVQQALA